jgi:hypothetical protein
MMDGWSVRRDMAIGRGWLVPMFIMFHVAGNNREQKKN